MHSDSTMRNNIALVASNSESYCIGCSVCRYSCPIGAISMEYDGEGFKVPVVDSEKCNDCGMCRNVCPVCTPVYDKAQTPRCFAALASDKLRTGRSASGAIFPVLAQEILDKGGVVCGAAWNKEWQCEHIIVDTVEGLERLKNSKYVQSDLEKCLPELKRHLEAERPVLFSGMPCQVAAIQAFLGKKYHHLYTVDLICHGVPSPMVWKRYLKENFDVERITYIAFRDKRRGEYGRSFVVEYEDGSQVWGTPASDPYFKGFLLDIMLRKSCCSCIFNKFPRQGDLTIGDFWGLEKVAPEMDDKKGVSVVFENSIKGCLLFDAVVPTLKMHREFPLKKALPSNPNIIQPSTEHPCRADFFATIEKRTVTSTLKYFTHDVSDCKIINYWFAVNYGAILTCYGLQECLTELGYTTKVINYMPDDWKKKYTGSFSEKFATKHLNLTNVIKNRSELVKLNEVTETFITGSDQVFRYNLYSTHGGTAYQLGFVAPEKRKISCAASFGYDSFRSPAFEETVFWKLLQDFDAISIREKSGVDLCRKQDLEAELLIDPVFYPAPQKWHDLADSNEEEVPEGGILYFRLPYLKDQNLAFLTDMEKALGLPVTLQDVDGTLSVEAWLDTIRKARFVVTDSFHGTCFALIMHKPFLCLSRYSEVRSRIDLILSKTDLSERFLDEATVSDHLDVLVKPIDWDAVDAVLASERTFAREWLSRSLAAPITKKDSSNMLVVQLYEEVRESKARIASLQTKIKSTNEAKQEHLAHMLCLIANERKIKCKYYRYKWISKLTSGKLRKRYFAKRIRMKEQLMEIRNFKKTH